MMIFRGKVRSKPNADEFVRVVKWWAIASIFIFTAYAVWCAWSIPVAIFDKGVTVESVEKVIKKLGPALSFLKSCIEALVAFSTIYGIVVALTTYESAKAASQHTNHIEYQTLFCNYVWARISNLDRVKPLDVDPVRWFNFIHPKSLDFGDRSTAQEYVELMRKILNLEQNYSVSGLAINHNCRQVNLNALLGNIGLRIGHLSRGDFDEVCGQVYTLIDEINASFCSGVDKLVVGAR